MFTGGLSNLNLRVGMFSLNPGIDNRNRQWSLITLSFIGLEISQYDKLDNVCMI